MTLTDPLQTSFCIYIETLSMEACFLSLFYSKLHFCISIWNLKRPLWGKERENAEYGFNKCSLFKVSQSSSVVSQKIHAQQDTKGKDYKDKQ